MEEKKERREKMEASKVGGKGRREKGRKVEWGVGKEESR